jgi:aspartate aminotransferase
MGIEVTPPDGTFYVFPRAPIPDDLEFVHRALEERVLLVPGVGFGCPGYFRLCFSVGDRTFDGGIEALARVCKRL